jgi:hypothetical protein
VQYRVVPMLGQAGKLKRAPDSVCSAWSDWVEVKTGKTPGFSAYFNRGIVAAQWIARLLGDAPGGPVFAGKDGDTWQDEFLSGEKKKELDFWFGKLGAGPA